MNDKDDLSTINRIDLHHYAHLKESEVITGGMIPKLENAFACLKGGVKKVIIGNAANLHELISGTSGTTIIK